MSGLESPSPYTFGSQHVCVQVKRWLTASYLRRYCIYPDATLGLFASRSLCESYHSMFTRTVDGAVGLANEAGNRCGIDDGTSTVTVCCFFQVAELG
jgi:hypothetical protein